MKITILGCGTSGGVPVIGDRWGSCDPTNPKNQRLRSSILVELAGKYILVDSSPDLRYQLLRAKVPTIDAVLYTHAHADHTHGLNDLCLVSRFKEEKIPVYGDKPTLDVLHQSFEYAFHNPDNEHYSPFLTAHEIRDTPFELFGQTIEPFEQDHGLIKSLGFKVGNFAYSTDVCKLKPEVLDSLKGIDTWVVDCLRYEPHTTHAHLDLTLEWINHVKPRRAILTHMSPHLDYETLKKDLPSGVEPAYDGLLVEV